jgi:glycosyltransferase involved in cell wall biosynthesis
MPGGHLPRIGMLAAQFAAYHVDRCAALARRFAGRAEVVAVEVASTSSTYAWKPSGEIPGAVKQTLFPGQGFEQIGRLRRWRAQFRALRGCKIVLIGIGYNQPDIILLSWTLRACGVQVIMLTESKFDDHPRRLGREWLKRLLLASYNGAIVGGQRQIGYARFLGFGRRPVLPGYDGVDVMRIRAQADAALGGRSIAWEDRDFVFVGRFVSKKNLETLLEGFAAYARAAGPQARRLQLIGSGELEAALRARAEALGIADRVIFPGFLDAAEVSARLAEALALILVSTEEQWGLVVNEALAVGLPVVVSTAVGSRDALVRNLINGYVVEPGSIAGIAQALGELSASQEGWLRMSEASRARAWLGDADRLADAVEILLDADAKEAGERLALFNSHLMETT